MLYRRIIVAWLRDRGYADFDQYKNDPACENLFTELFVDDPL